MKTNIAVTLAIVSLIITLLALMGIDKVFIANYGILIIVVFSGTAFGLSLFPPEQPTDKFGRVFARYTSLSLVVVLLGAAGVSRYLYGSACEKAANTFASKIKSEMSAGHDYPLKNNDRLIK
jgi:drug/metabolite transporter superfamily protein YnfA